MPTAKKLTCYSSGCDHSVLSLEDSNIRVFDADGRDCTGDPSAIVRAYCAECFSDSDSTTCHLCGLLAIDYHLYCSAPFNSNRTICTPCYDAECANCDDCGETYLGESLNRGRDSGLYCANCEPSHNRASLDNESRTCDSRAILNPLKIGWRNLEKPLPVAYEIEVEFSNSTPSDIAEKLIDLHDEMDIGFCRDGSLSNGVEVQTPPAHEPESQAIVESVCKLFKSADCKAQSTCGLHLHIATGKLSNKHVHRLFSSWYAFENLAFALVPASRRTNSFCQSWHKTLGITVEQLATWHPNTVEAMLYSKFTRASNFPRLPKSDLSKAIKILDRDRSRVENDKREKYGADRYFAANIHSIYRQGSLEIRLAAGTIDPKKMLYWSRFCRAICDFARVPETVWKETNSKLLTPIEEATNIVALVPQFATLTPTTDDRIAAVKKLFTILKLDDETASYMLARFKLLNGLNAPAAISPNSINATD